MALNVTDPLGATPEELRNHDSKAPYDKTITTTNSTIATTTTTTTLIGILIAGNHHNLHFLHCPHHRLLRVMERGGISVAWRLQHHNPVLRYRQHLRQTSFGLLRGAWLDCYPVEGAVWQRERLLLPKLGRIRSWVWCPRQVVFWSFIDKYTAYGWVDCIIICIQYAGFSIFMLIWRYLSPKRKQITIRIGFQFPHKYFKTSIKA